MAETISIMVNNLGSPKVPIPQFLCERNGAWQVFGTASPDFAMAEIQANLGRRLDLTMDALQNNPAPVGGMLDAISSTLYELMLPEKLRQVLTTAAANAGAEAPDLRIHIAAPALDWIPWELMRDSVDYLGVRFRIGRFPISPTIPPIDETRPREVRSITNLLGQQVLDDQSPLAATWLQTFAAPAAVRQTTMPNAHGADPPGWPTLRDVTAAMVSDILHITCHGRFDDTDQSYYWAIDPSNTIGSMAGVNTQTFALFQLSNGRPLVFANACALPDQAKGVLPGFGRDFFTRGAQNAIGAFARLTKETAIPFAKAFYQRLLVDGQPIGQAMLETKREFHTKRVDPSHLFYCLYGPPGTRFKYPD